MNTKVKTNTNKGSIASVPYKRKEIVICLDSGTLELFDDNGDSLFKTQVVTGCSSNATRIGTYTAKKKWTPNKKNPEYPVPWNEDKTNPYGPWFLELYDSKGIYSTYGIHGTVGAGDSTSVTPPFSSLTPESWYWKCSHGCTRVSNVDIQKLHDLLPNPVGMKIIIKDCK